MPRAPSVDSACLAAALDYARRGWPALPLCPPDHAGVGDKHRGKCDRPGKVPLRANWQETVLTEKDLRNAWRLCPGANVGVSLGPISKMVALDIDGAAGVELLDALARKFGGPMPDTLSFRSGGGGGRLFFALGEGSDPPIRHWKVGERKVLSFLAGGAQTVMPPSLHISGEHYEWSLGFGLDEIEPAPCPDWLLVLAGQVERKEEAAPPPALFGPSSEAVGARPAAFERARAYLRTCDPAISGQSGHDQAIKIADKVAVGFDLTAEEAVQLLWEEWNDRCRPPWTRRELEHKVAEAVENSPRIRGYLLREERSKPEHREPSMQIPPIPKVAAASSPPAKVDAEPAKDEEEDATVADLLAAQATLRWAWESWIPLGVLTAIAAEPGCGKTRFCGDLARRIFHGLPWPDGSPPTLPRGSKTLWVPADNQHPQLTAIAGEMMIPPEALVLNAPRKEPFGGAMLDAPEDLKAFEARIRRVEPGLVFIDTSLNSTDRGCTKPEDAKRYFVPLQQIAQRVGTPILCITHLNAAGRALGLRIRGQCRVVVHLSHPEGADENRRRLWVDKSIALYPPVLGVTMGQHGNDYDLDPPRDGKDEPGERTTRGVSPAVERVVEWLKRRLANGPVRVSILRMELEDIEVSSKTMYAARKPAGVVQYIENGTWWRLCQGEDDEGGPPRGDPFPD